MFRPTAEKLLPDLSPREELVLLARTLWREGYADHLAGHITIRQPDGTLLCNPWYLLWSELRPEDVIRIDLDGRVVEGDWPAPLGIPLHLELHRLREVDVALHNHPQWGTVWANLGRVPPIYDQSSGLGGGRVTVVDEYGGGVSDANLARDAVVAMGDADIALLRNHGVFILGTTVRAVHQRAVAFEQRCRMAYLVEQGGGGRPVVPAVEQRMSQSDGNGFLGFWEAMVRQELAADPTLLGSAR
jgi:ribulose-5-phosphate 4-epimerase/fuculose-1-phosphate aldolase